MITKVNRSTAALGVLILVWLAPACAWAASAGTPGETALARAFVATLAKGKFAQAEEHFTEQMKRAAPPDKLRGLWQSLVGHFGPFEKIDRSKSAIKDGYNVVIVGADFKKRSIGLQVAFDSAERIAGLYVVPPP